MDRICLGPEDALPREGRRGGLRVPLVPRDVQHVLEPDTAARRAPRGARAFFGDFSFFNNPAHLLRPPSLAYP